MDHAAATPVRTEVLEAMAPYFSVHYGNPSAVHAEGQHGRASVESARESIARLLNIRPIGVYFTASGTEANNLALYGVVRAVTAETGKEISDIAIISTKIEHPSILRVLEDLERQGVTVKYVDVGTDGRIDEKHLSTLLGDDVVLMTFAYANSEIGTVQEVKRLTRIIKKYNSEHGTDIRTHLDAAQAPLWLPIEMDMLGVDMMSLDAGKCRGPKGVGVLAARHGVDIHGVILGGEQENGKRAGTENTPLIVGCAKAFELAVVDQASRSAAVTALREYMIDSLTTQIDGVVLNGSYTQRIANNINISIPGIDTEFAVVTLDKNGVACSTKSACGGAGGVGSEVVYTISGDSARADATLRFSLGEEIRRSDIDYVVAVLAEHTSKMRAFHGSLPH